MSGDEEQEYFADGISEDIITDLSKISGLHVIARNLSFVYMQSAVSIPDVPKALGVRYVLEGSVRKVGNRVRVTAQLIDAMSGGHVWAGRFDREHDRLAKTNTVNIQAYEFLLHSRDQALASTPAKQH